jgi:hypothetical protein
MPETALTSGSQGGTEGGGQAGSDQGAGAQQQAQPTGWRGTLSEDIRGEKSFDVFKGEKWEEVGPVMAKSFIAAEKMTGNAIHLPKKDATPEERAKILNDIYVKLGKPEKEENYQYQKPNFVSKDVQWDDGMAKEFLGVAHKIGLNNEQVQALIGWQGSRMDKDVVNAREQIQGTINTLKKEWGSDYERRVVLGERAVRQVGGDELVNLLEKTGLGNNSVFVKVFAEIGDILAEDGLIEGKVEGVLGAEDYQSKIEAIMMDRKHPLNNISHPGHKGAVEELTRLNKALHSARR